MLTVPLNDLRRVVIEDGSALRSTIDRVVDSGWYIFGPEHDGFEKDLAAYLGVTGAVAVGNGTDALEMAMAGLGVRPGSRVVTVANAGGYSSVAANRLGATPVLVDVAADSYLMDPESLRVTLAGCDAAAVVVTHLFGAMPDMGQIIEICRQFEVPVIEDCAQAIGATWDGKRAGTWGDVGAFSFYPTKNLGALGDGGAVVTDEQELATRLRALRQYGWTEKYRVEVAGGRNSRLDELQAAVLRVRLGMLDARNYARAAIAKRYGDALAGSEHRLLHAGSEGFVAHLAVVDTPRRDEMMRFLSGNGIGTAIHYPVGDHEQPGLDTESVQPLVNTDAALKRILTVPCFPELTAAEVEHVAATLNRFAAS
ncbi:MAG: DegT/DnrJ/EryC1/StrS family aminotransferase [Actinomycetes bacterium]